MDETSEGPDIFELAAGDLAIGLVPEIGGSLAYFRKRRGDSWVDLMRPLTPVARQRRDVMGTAMFPMVPYANRIAGNSFTFEGETYRVHPNVAGERFNVHGSGWLAAWSVEMANAANAILRFDYHDHDGPYTFTAGQRFALGADRLTVTMSITNRGKRRMPFGFGLHPWYPRDRDVTIAFRANSFWLEGPDHVATDRIATPPELDFANARPLPATWRNNDYGGWNGTADIRFPSRQLGLRIEADPMFGHLMLYCDPQKPVFCLEPQTNAVCAFNKLENGEAHHLGIIVLEPGAYTEGSLVFAPFDL